MPVNNLDSKGDPKDPNSPMHRLHDLRESIDRERAKKTSQLDSLGQWHESTDWSLRTVRLMDQAGVRLGDMPGILQRIGAAAEAFGQEFPQTDEPNLSRLQILFDSTSGSVYSAATGSYSSYEDAATLNEYHTLTGEYEERQKMRGVRAEVETTLLRLAPQAAVKFRAAWDGFYAAVPVADPSSGPALEMRSALDLTMTTLMKRVAPPPHTLGKKDWLAHVAEHAAIDPTAATLLCRLGPEYPRLKGLLSQVKDKTDLGRERLRTLLVESTDFLSTVLRGVDFSNSKDEDDGP
jgi:hypothetical protein